METDDNLVSVRSDDLKPPVRLDEWAAVAMAPTAVPFERKPKGSVFRPFHDEHKALAYAREVCKFFAEHGTRQPVFVIKGPTSTTKAPFEVVEASCGYTIVHRVEMREPVAVAAPDAPPQLPSPRRMRP